MDLVVDMVVGLDPDLVLDLDPDIVSVFDLVADFIPDLEPHLVFFCNGGLVIYVHWGFLT